MKGRDCMKFEKYQHIERLGTAAVDGILDGTCYIFPKLDGTNTSVYLNDAGEIEVASRNRVLSIDDDNRGVCQYVLSQPKFHAYLKKFPTHRLFGEWLVPHTIRGYLDDAWRKLYIFDVMDGDKYLHYGEYANELAKFGIDYISAISCLENPTIEALGRIRDANTYLMKDGVGEGIVIKNYDFVNRFGRVVWAKLVRLTLPKIFKTPMFVATDAVESQIVDKFLTPDLIEKEFAKIASDGWQSQFIPRLLSTVWHVFITEETANFIKKFHNPKVDFAFLKRLCVAKIKSEKPELFR